jgi:WD40 repeat protein
MPDIQTLRQRAYAPTLSYSQQRRWLADVLALKKREHLTRAYELQRDEIVTYFLAIMWERDDLHPIMREKLKAALNTIAFPLSTFRLGPFPVDYNPGVAVLSPNGKYIAAGTYLSSAKLLDIVTGEELREFPGNVLSMTFSPDGRYLLIGSGEIAYLWDVSTGKELRRFVGHQDAIFHMAFSNEGQFALTCTIPGSPDSTARLWDVATGEELRQFPDRQNGIGIFNMAFSPDSQYVLIGHNTVARMHHRATGAYIRQFENGPNFTSVGFSPNGKFILTSNHLIAVLWDANTGEQLRQFSDGNIIDNATFSSNGQSILTTGSKGALLWDMSTGKLLHRIHWPTDYVTSAGLSLDNKYVFTCGSGGVVRLWQV